MLSYNVAKALKDAGFPQHAVPSEGDYYENGEDVSCPTPEELLEAMQGRYKYVEGLINDAQACIRKSVSADGHIYIAWLDGDWESAEYEDKYRFISKDAREALANLWLALNKNRKNQK